MSSKKPNVLVVSDERALLRQISSFLELFGYHVQQAADPQLAANAMLAEPADIVLVDQDIRAQSSVEFCRKLCSGLRRPYTVLLTADTGAEDVRFSVEAGVDDVIRKPIVYGEMLARLRTGIQVRRHEVGNEQRSAVDLLTGLPNARGASLLIDEAFALAKKTEKPLGCVCFDIDFFCRVDRSFGAEGAEVVLKQLASFLCGLCDGGIQGGRLGEDTFCAVLPNASGNDASDWAERARAALDRKEFECGLGTVRLTGSFGVSWSLRDDRTGEDVLQRALAAMRLAKQSGRNCVARHGQFDGEAAQLQRTLSPDNLFSAAVAGDVMTPCGVLLCEDDTVDEVVGVFAGSDLEVVPVVDANGNLTGIVSAQELVDTSSTVRIGDIAQNDVPTHDATTPFRELFEFFVAASRTETVIVDQGRPVGVVTRAGLLDLIDTPSMNSSPEAAVAS
ncbi:MAG: diguanylate cyclase [Pirellulales bacterium]|nr:diguanylate cyclase [Planctomycetales bacterium]